MKKKLLLLLVFCLAAALLLVTGAAADDTLTGTCGDGVTWTATETVYAGVEGYAMTITGSYESNEITITGFDFDGKSIGADDIVTVKIQDYGSTYIIGEGAFEGFTNLRELNVYSGTDLKSIGANAFADCANLRQFNYSGENWNNVKISGGNDFVLALEPQPGCEFNLVDGNGNTWNIKYNNYTYQGEESATATVTKGTGNGVVDGFPGENENNYIVYNQPDIKELIIDDGITEYNGTDRMNQLEEVTIGKDLITIGDRAFENSYDYREFTVTFDEGSQLKSIGDRAFSFTDLTTITLPDSVETIGDNAFSNCRSLTSINIPDGVTSIGGGAFGSCKALTNISIPDSVTAIGDSAFSYCSSLNSITLGNRVKSIGTYTFQDCTALTNISIPNSVTGIGTGAFNGCTSLKTLTLGSGVETIDNNTFQGCNLLTDFTLPSGLKSIGDNAFNGCAALTKVDMPDSVTYLGAGAYQNCTSLTSATLSEKLSEMNNSVFAGCTGLTTVTLPDLVNNIGNYLFQGCSKLVSVYTGDYIQFVGSSNFDGCSDSLTVYGYPGSYMEVYCETYDINFAARSDAPASGAGIENITSSTGVNPETGEVCTVITITLSDGRTQKFYLDNEVNSIEDITSRPGFDPDGKPCTVVTISMTNGDVERFYVYDGKDGEDGETVVTPAFTDVPATAYYADAVAWAVANGITTGTDENTFSPNAPCTRAQVVTFLWRAMGSPEPRSAGTFTDVDASSYYAKAVRWALENGITSGTSATTFEPNAVCTRAQVVTFLMRALDGRSYGSAGFADVAASSYYADAVAWAVANGITDGTGATTFSPDTQCNRAQIVTFLYRAVA